MVFLDDYLLVGKSIESCTQNITDTVTLFDKLGFVVHPDKSILEPTQVISYLGFQISSVSMIITLTEDREGKIIAYCLNIHDQPGVTIRELACLIGQLIAAFPSVMHGPLQYRALERYKASAIKANKGIWEAKIEMCKAINIIMSSWRPEIRKVYATYIRKWRESATKRTQDPSSASIVTAIDFLTELHKQGASYSSLCISRSALSCLLRVSDDITFGGLPIVKRMMKGFYELKPSTPQTARTCMWSVDDVLNT